MDFMDMMDSMDEMDGCAPASPRHAGKPDAASGFADFVEDEIQDEAPTSLR